MCCVYAEQAQQEGIQQQFSATSQDGSIAMELHQHQSQLD